MTSCGCVTAWRGDRVAFTLTAIQDICGALGYNVTREGLRIVDDIEADGTTLDIPRALPILILPYWDNAINVHYVIPSADGTACDFTLDGIYQSPTYSFGLLRAVPRSVRMNRTDAWLQKPGGKWRHGWYEDSAGVPWVSNMGTSANGSWLGVTIRYFDTLAGKELDSIPTEFSITIETWGKSFTTKSEMKRVDQAYVSNGRRFGLFFFEALRKSTTTNSYSLETFISNMSIFLLLFRWFVSMAAMVHSYRKGVAEWQTSGIGCLSSSRTFNVLPIMLLPRLKMTLTVLFTTGGFFEGQQQALSDAWYVMYPGIVELLFCYYSLLNIIGKITYRRISDALFGPTLLFLWILHYSRVLFAQNGWFGIDGRIATVLLSSDVDTLTLPDFLTTDVALRLNGNVQTLLLLKLIVLALNLIPLLLGEKMTVNGTKSRSFAPYELNRLGYLVFGSKFLISYEDWYVLSSTAPLRVIERLWNYGVSVFDVTKSNDGSYFEVSAHPRLCRLDEHPSQLA